MKFNYYYNQVPGQGEQRTNLIYTSLMSEDKKTFVQWYYNDTESRKKNPKYLIGKSGRTKYDVTVRSEQCAPKTGRKHDVICLWGFRKDKWYLPTKIKSLKPISQSKKFLSYTKDFFKQYFDYNRNPEIINTQ